VASATGSSPRSALDLPDDGLLVLGPLIFPLSLPLNVTPPVQAFVDAIDKVPNGSTVLMSCDYDPARSRDGADDAHGVPAPAVARTARSS
jgi:hypothetical protein